jgi:predicted secreted Zn-dependent protease
MKKILLILCAAALLFWWLGHGTRRVTLPDQPVALGSAGSYTDSQALSVSSARPGEVLEVSTPGTEMDFYSISGNSAAELRTSMNQQHPVSGFDGNTHWNVSWQWPGYGSSDCRLQEAKLETRITVSLPRWSPPRDADPALILQWNRYLGSLALHEQGHVQRAREGFAKMQQILQSSHCDNADAQLNAVMGEMHDADLRYDADTDHGSTQGARFP